MGLCGGPFGVGVFFCHRLDYKEYEMKMLDSRAEAAEAKREKILEVTGTEVASKGEAH